MDKVKIFVSYSHQNEDWVSVDGKYRLIPWLKNQLAEDADIWTDHALKQQLGEEYTKLITSRISESGIVILLISQDFVSSQYIMEVELPLVRQLYKKEKLKIIPLLLTDLTKKGKEKISWIFDLQTYPNDTKPLIDFVNSDSGWSRIKVDILEGVENKIEEINGFPGRQTNINNGTDSKEITRQTIKTENKNSYSSSGHKTINSRPEILPRKIIKPLIIVSGCILTIFLSVSIIHSSNSGSGTSDFPKDTLNQPVDTTPAFPEPATDSISYIKSN